MQEFDCIKVSSYEAETLSARLTERSAEGWGVVSVVAAGSDIVAYLSRETNGARATATPAAAEEPRGWGTEPAAATTEPAAGETGWGTAGGTAWGSSSGSGQSWGSSSASEPAAPSQAPSTPTVPAGWYADPANRYELRYWDGTAWTEHVSRAGQQYTDPPVA